MKKSEKDDKKKMMPNPSALEGVPERNPHEEFAKKDAMINERRGVQR